MYPPVMMVTPDELCLVDVGNEQRCSSRTSPIPLIDPTLLLRPIAPVGTMLAVASPRHLRSTNASPSVNSWSGGEHSQLQQQRLCDRHHPQHSHSTSNFNGLTVQTVPILLSDPHMAFPESTRALSSSSYGEQGVPNVPTTKGVVLNRCPVASSGFSAVNLSASWPLPESLSDSQIRARDEGGGGGGGGKSRLPTAGLAECVTENRQDGRLGSVGQQEIRFLDNPNIDELFLGGSVSQQNLAGKRKWW